jgi:putative FmdB family regulatory protein
MPIYQYECEKCSHRFESVRQMSQADTGLRCPQCGRETAKKVFAPFFTPSAGGSCAPRGGG